MIDVEALYREAKLPKYMRDTDSGREALGRLVALALEAAAKECDAEADTWDLQGEGAWSAAGHSLAERIRALKPS